MSQIADIFCNKLHRNPTDVEIMDLIQSNNEHCRHFLLNGKVIIDGIEQPHTMSELLRSCKPTTEFPSTLISFGQDGSAIRGTLCEALTSTQPGQPSPVEPSYQNKNPVATVTTHNFPSASRRSPERSSCLAETSPTGPASEDRFARWRRPGNGASVMGGAAGFMVGNLRIPGYEQPWESEAAYPSRCVWRE